MNNALRRTSVSYYQVEKVPEEFGIGCLKVTVGGGAEPRVRMSTQSMPIRKGEGGHPGRRDHLRLVLGAILWWGHSTGQGLEKGRQREPGPEGWAGE